MASSRQIETSLLTEHLRYTPLTLLDDIINTVNELVSRAVDAAEQGLLSADPANLGFAHKAAAEGLIPDTDGEGNSVYPEARSEIEEGVHKLETLLESNVDRNFDKLEIYALRNVLTVPADLLPWARLGHYENLSLPSPNSPSQNPTPESIQQLRRELQETRKLHSALQTTVKRNNVLISQLHSLLQPPQLGFKAEQSSSLGQQKQDTAGAFSFLTHSQSAKTLGMTPVSSASAAAAPAPGTAPLETNTSFTISQLPALRSLLDDLRPKLAGLGSTGPGGQESEQARERRLYIENMTRKVLERRGVEIGEDSSEFLGRRIPAEELAALESVVDNMGGGGSGRMEE